MQILFINSDVKKYIILFLKTQFILSLLYVPFWHRKRNLVSINIVLFSFHQVTVGRWCLLCPDFGGWWSECGAWEFQSMGISPEMYVIPLDHWPSIYSEWALLLLPDLFRNLALSIPSLSCLRLWESLQGCRSSYFPRCELISLLPGLFPARSCRFSLSLSEIYKQLYIFSLVCLLSGSGEIFSI